LKNRVRLSSAAAVSYFDSWKAHAIDLDAVVSRFDLQSAIAGQRSPICDRSFRLSFFMNSCDSSRGGHAIDGRVVHDKELEIKNSSKFATVVSVWASLAFPLASSAGESPATWAHVDSGTSDTARHPTTVGGLPASAEDPIALMAVDAPDTTTTTGNNTPSMPKAVSIVVQSRSPDTAKPSMSTYAEKFANTPKPPYYAVLFAIQASGRDKQKYEAAGERMIELAKMNPGFLGGEAAADNDGFELYVSYWRDEDSIKRFKSNVEHLMVQKLGKEVWFKKHVIRIAKVERAYGGEIRE
jgi:heme-degrading monooxygenase HmoA